MRIIHVVPSYIPAWRYGGPIHSVHGLCKALAARGHEIGVVTTNVDGQRDSDVPIGQPVDLDGVSVRYFRSERLRRLFYAPAMYRFLEDSMDRWQLVHTHSVFLWPTAAAAHVARKHAVPHVLSPRGMLDRKLIERRSTLAKRAWIKLVETRNVNRASAVHVTSRREAAGIVELGFRPRRVIEVPNGIDLPDTPAAPDRHRTQAGEGYVLYLGRISWKKGIDRLIDAMTHVPNARLVVAGNDEEGCMPELMARAARLAIVDRVRFVGFVEGDVKQRLLKEASALALPSLSENFGNAVLEAMASGTPVVVTPEVGIADLIAETGSGLVVSGAPDEFGKALATVVSDAALRRRLGESGLKAASSLTWDAIAARFETQYVSVLQSP